MDSLYVLIKPVSGICNLRCAYCFYASLGEAGAPTGGRMTDETADLVIGRALETGARRITFAFQGGEPTLAGLPFYRRFCASVRKKNAARIPVSYAIQTNGLAVDEAFAAFFAEEKFLVGVSLDGGKEIHDALRRDPAGRGTWSRVSACLRLLGKARVDYNLLCVVSASVARHGAAVYEALKKTGCRALQFIPCIPPFEGQGEPGPHALTPEAYLAFLRAVFPRWAEDLRRGDYVSVRYFDNLVRLAAGRPPEMCGLFGRCPGQLIVEADGACYPCDFYVLPEYRMGDLHVDSIADLMASPARRRFIESSAAVAEDCLSCPVSALCRGGCRRDRQSDPAGPVGKNRYCAAFRTFLAEAAPILSDIARRM